MVKKIRLSASYDTSENLTKRLLKQFLTPDIDLSVNFTLLSGKEVTDSLPLTTEFFFPGS